ncbi:guanylate kinase [Lentisphaerota bacterium ZTH]|nr:guanylate kinase [Lentisphaerota bacterium]WET05996.1 guanylate kinase [Lentisphaerota bacterium ZTH]
MRNNKTVRNGILIVVSGASGTGKSTVCSRVRELMPELGFSVSCTTRQPRPGEQEGREYYFVSRDEFAARIERGDFIEYAEVFSNCYGTLKSEVLEKIQNGKDVFLDIDIQGALQIQAAAEKDELLKACTEFIFIVPPSLQELEQRLRGRASDSEAQVMQRLEKARHEISFWKKYDYVIENDDLDQAVTDMVNLIRSLHLAVKRMPEDKYDA